MVLAGIGGGVLVLRTDKKPQKPQKSEKAEKSQKPRGGPKARR
jgi:hypothetical protein